MSCYMKSTWSNAVSTHGCYGCCSVLGCVPGVWATRGMLSQQQVAELLRGGQQEDLKGEWHFAL